MIHQVIPWGDFIGLAAGHVYYYFEDVYPRLAVGRGKKVLQTPIFLTRLLG